MKTYGWEIAADAGCLNGLKAFAGQVMGIIEEDT